MTNSMRILLAQIATFEAQHKAGITPPCSALAEFFDTARLARLDVDAFDRGLALPDEAPLAPPRAPLTFDRVDEGVVELRATVPLAPMARAVLERLATTPPGRRIVIETVGGGPAGT